ncbi:ABC transporter substrate-binding protein [Pilimelia terevasa]|uniref:ABC transporter substrate-binding protein n=1 Tax=Pilimelia terevasa TaxID=53372 RepID=A0A8J3FGT1_9ACTN|nr:ABC transporter substrate-binding protein [Pilimelia terevasa]GGK23367.1 ABC transporter substrate-binding protein [Pilimelia terevasa]
MSHPTRVGLLRRSTLCLVGAALAVTGLAACGEEAPQPAGRKVAASSGPWTYTDASGTPVTLPRRPERIVAYVGSAAALWDLGVKPVGVFGPQKRPDGSKDPQAGNVDVDAVTSVGNSWDDFNLEKFLALKPDLVVTGRYGKGADELWALPAESLAKIRATAPVVGINEYQAPLLTVIDDYRKLAASLGADLDAPEQKAAVDGFTKAGDALKAALVAKPGLKVMFAYADKTNFYVTKPEYFGDISYYRSLGMDMVVGGGTEEHWEMLSWEQAGKYPADLIITDSRSHALSHDQLAAIPTWKQLPAVKANQIGLWPGESRFSHLLSTKVVQDMTALIGASRPDVV